MAATDSLTSFLNTLSDADKEKVKDLIRDLRQQMFAARSEDARVRLVQSFLVDANEVLKRK